MSKIAEQKALEAYPDPQILPGFDSNKHYREGYIVGYDQAIQDFLENAEKILTERMYFSDDEAKELVEDFIKQFKNYIQDESEK